MGEPNESTAAAVREFVADLRTMRAEDGAPSFALLARRTGLPRSTVYDGLRRDRLPSWELTVALVTALGGDEDAWHARWTALRVQIDTPDGSDGPDGPAGSDGSDGSDGSAGSDAVIEPVESVGAVNMIGSVNTVNGFGPVNGFGSVSPGSSLNPDGSVSPGGSVGANVAEVSTAGTPGLGLQPSSGLQPPSGPGGGSTSRRHWRWLVAAGVVAALTVGGVTYVLTRSTNPACKNGDLYSLNSDGQLLDKSGGQVAPVTRGDLVLVTNHKHDVYQHRLYATLQTNGKSGYVDEARIDPVHSTCS